MPLCSMPSTRGRILRRAEARPVGISANGLVTTNILPAKLQATAIGTVQWTRGRARLLFARQQSKLYLLLLKGKCGRRTVKYFVVTHKKLQLILAQICHSAFRGWRLCQLCRTLPQRVRVRVVHFCLYQQISHHAQYCAIHAKPCSREQKWHLN